MVASDISEMDGDVQNKGTDIAQVECWSVDTVQDWMSKQNFDTPVCETFRANAIDGYSLVRLTEDDLRQQPMSLQRLGDIKHIIGAVDSLVPRKLPSCEGCCRSRQHFITGRSHVAADVPDSTSRRRSLSCRSRSGSVDDAKSPPSQYNRRKYATHLKPEKRKALAAAVYGCVSLYLCSFMMTVANERVPDMERNPPLPDLLLDILPYIPWAFRVSEYISMTLFLIFGIIIFTHKHRYIIIRRFLSLGGTLYLLRGICMLITSLSVPCRFFECHVHVNKDLYSKLRGAWDIMMAGGMAVDGYRYCGDYMFSGHTTTLTLLSLFIDEYGDKNYPIVQTFSWILNLFGIFLVMAGHEHYSIDVFIAFYLTTRLFLYYHTLADNKARLRYDERKVRVWFPLFSYFEAEVDGAVPYEYDWPIRVPDRVRLAVSFIASKLE